MTKRRKEQTIQWPKEEKNKQYNGQKKERTDNTMAKRRKEQTIQWPKEGKNRQYHGQKKKRTNNAMAKRRKEQKNKQYNDQKKKRTNNTMTKRRKEQTFFRKWPFSGEDDRGQTRPRALVFTRCDIQSERL
jgi:hypothetical protein